MKRFLSVLLVLVLCLGVFVACQPEETAPAATVDDAKTYLANMYKDSASNLTNDYDLVGKVIVSGVTFTVTWKSNVSEITIKESTKKDFWTVDLPDTNTEDKEYVLTATIADANGKTATLTLNRTLPAFEKVAGVVTDPVAETAYKLFLTQKNIGKTLFVLAEDTGKYIKTTIDPKAAADFYVEKSGDGVKIYTNIAGAKKYLVAAAELKDDGKVSKSITYGDNGSVFIYNREINAWYTVVDNIKYCIGTYGTYDTVSISEDSYYTPENTGVEQFPVEFILKADGEAMNPTEGPADPTELTPIKTVVELGKSMAHNTFTVEKYLVKGTITEIANPTYGNLYISDAEGNTIYIYGLWNNDGSVRFDAMNPQPKVGDTITVMSIVGQYNDAAQLKNAWTVELVAVACTNHVYDNDCDADCNICKATREVAGHQYANDCDADCDICAATREVAGHQYADDCDADCNVCAATRTAPHKVTADCDDQCDLCGAEITTSATHTYDAECDKDCNKCGSTRVADCKDENADGKCDICGEVVDATTIEKGHIAHEAGKLVFANVHVNGEANLPAQGKDYADVTITWKADNTTVATIANGKVTFANNGNAEVTVTLTATFVCGGTTETKTFTVKVSVHSYENNCDATCDSCGASRTPADHVYANNCDADCNVCGATRTPAECVDANKDGACDSCGAVVESFPKLETPYKLYLFQGNLNKTLYFKGEMSGYYFATTETVTEGVNLYFEKVDGGYNIYFEVAGAKKYLAVINTGSHYNVVFDQAPSVFTYDETLDTMVTEVPANGEKAGGTFYLGTYGTYNTFSASTVDKAPTSFVGHFAEVVDPSKCTHSYAVPCAPTCTLCGADNANPQHNYADATCTAPKTCSACGATSGEALGHNYVGGTCTVCGASEGGIKAVAAPEVGVEYYLISTAGAGDLAFNGTISSGRINAVADYSAAVKVTLEAGAAEGEYYITFMNGSTKTYLSVNTSASSKTAAFVFATEKDDNCVWVIDETTQSIQSKVFTGRGIGTQVTSTYTNFSTYSYSSNGTSTDYDWAWFYN